MYFAAFSGDSIDATVQMVAAGVAEVVLHVADDRVLPVEHIQSAIAADFHIAWTKIAIRRVENRLHFLRKEACSLLFELVLSHSLEPDHVGDQQITPIRFRKMLAVQNCDRRNRTNSLFVKLARSPVTRHPDVVAGPACAIGRELVAPLVEGVAVWIRADREMKVDVKRDRIPFVDSGSAGAESLGRPPGSFEVLGVENPAGKIELPARAHHKTVRRVMCVGRIEPMKNAFANIGHVITVEVFQEENIRSLCDKNAAVPEFKTRRIMQPVGKRDAAIGDAVMIFVGENQQLVVHSFERIPVRIRRPCGDPQTSVRIDRTLHRIGEV